MLDDNELFPEALGDTFLGDGGFTRYSFNSSSLLLSEWDATVSATTLGFFLLRFFFFFETEELESLRIDLNVLILDTVLDLSH